MRYALIGAALSASMYAGWKAGHWVAEWLGAEMSFAICVALGIVVWNWVVVGERKGAK